jgi:hypothetical protein
LPKWRGTMREYIENVFDYGCRELNLCAFSAIISFLPAGGSTRRKCAREDFHGIFWTNGIALTIHYVRMVLGSTRTEPTTSGQDATTRFIEKPRPDDGQYELHDCIYDARFVAAGI